jgi:hypothetical protein
VSSVVLTALMRIFIALDRISIDILFLFSLFFVVLTFTHSLTRSLVLSLEIFTSDCLYTCTVGVILLMRKEPSNERETKSSNQYTVYSPRRFIAFTLVNLD